MSQVVTHMGEVGANGPYAARSFHRLSYRHVRHVRGMPESIEDQDLRTARSFFSLLGHLLAVGKICQDVSSIPAEQQATGRGAPVRQIKRNYFRLSEPEGTVDTDGFRADVSEKATLRLKSILKDASQVIQRPLSRIDRHRLIFHFAESAQIIETKDMVGMRMRIDDRVDAGDGFAQTLRTKVWRGIDLDDHLGRSQLNCASQAFITRIDGRAYSALAADYRNAMRCASAKKRNFDFPHCVPFMA